MRHQSELHAVARYYMLAILISWIAWLPLVLSKKGIGLLSFDMPMPWTITGTLGPLLAALLMWRRKRGGTSSAIRALLAMSPKALVGAVAGGLAVGATFVIGTALVLSQDPPHGWHADAIALYGFHFATTLLGGPVFEEWGWRGFAQPRLQAAWGPLPAALAIGLGWALWHLPLFLIPTWSSASLPVYIGMVTALSVMMSWGFNASGQWIGAAILMHFIYNASSRVLGEFLGDATLRAWPDPVLAICLAFAAGALLITIATRGRLGARQPGNFTA